MNGDDKSNYVYVHPDPKIGLVVTTLHLGRWVAISAHGLVEVKKTVMFLGYEIQEF